MADGSVVIEAILDTANVSKNVKNLGSSLNGISWKNLAAGDDKAKALSGSFKAAGTAATISLTTPIVAAGAAAFGLASNYEQATSRIQAAFGGTREDAEQLSQVGKGIYENGFGESLDAVNDALITTRQNLGYMDDADMSYVTQAMITLSDTMDMDVGESTRGINALMIGFGMSAKDATDLFVAGAQNGLNYSDELGDNLAEYGPRFAQMGFSADEYFRILQGGVESGAYNLDKCNDFLNEFQTSLADGRMDEQIGKFSASTQEMFQAYKDGSASGKDVYNAIISEMQGMTNETQRAQIASELWSSLGEDNAMAVLMAMDGSADAYYKVGDAAQEMCDTASDSFDNKMTTALRELQGSIEPLGEPLLNIATNVAGVVKSFAEWFSSIGSDGQTAVLIVAGIVAAFGPMLSAAGTMVTLISTVNSFRVASEGAKAAQLGLNAAMSANPVGIVIAVVAALVAAVIYLWNTNEDFRNAVIAAWDAVCQAASALWAWIDANLIQPAQAGFQAFMDFLNLLFTDPFAALRMAGEGILSWFDSMFPGVSTTIGNVITGAQAFFTDPFGTLVSATGSCIDSIDQTFPGFKDCVSQVVGAAQNFFVDPYGSLVTATSAVINFIDSIFPGFKDTVASVIGGVQDFFRDPFAPLRDAVNSIIQWWADHFKLPSIQWPNITLPHFSIQPNGWQIGDLLQGSIPSLGIDWYAKGGVFNGASVIGVGEAGAEAVVPLSGRRMQPFAEAISGEMGGQIDYQKLAAAIVAALASAIDGTHVRLDGKATVGELVVPLARALATQETRESR